MRAVYAAAIDSYGELIDRHRFMEGWDEEADEATVRARAYRPEQARWIGLFLRSGYLGCHWPLAVEEIVYEWLWSDLQRIKWVGPGRIAEDASKTPPDPSPGICARGGS